MHSLKLKKEKYKELYAFRKGKERKKKERKKKRDICCFTLPTWLNKAGSLKGKERKKEERKQRKKKKERHLCLRLCWCNIASTLNICLILTY